VLLKAYSGEMAKQILISPKPFTTTVNSFGLSLNDGEGGYFFLIMVAEGKPYTTGGGRVRAFQMSLTVDTCMY